MILKYPSPPAETAMRHATSLDTSFQDLANKMHFSAGFLPLLIGICSVINEQLLLFCRL